jgi:ribose transport system permease protein
VSAAPAVEGGQSRAQAVQRFVADNSWLVLIVVLVGLIVATDIASPGFVSARQLSTTVLYAAPLALLAAGQTLVLLTGGVDLSVSNTATAAAYILADQGGTGTVRAILIALAVGLVIGFVNGLGVGVFNVQPLIMTLGMGSIVLGALSAAAAQNVFSNAPLVPAVVHRLGSDTAFNYIPKDVFLWAPLALIIILGLRYSGYGRTIYAVGDNPLACRLAGIRVWQVLLLTYTICGLLSAVAGIILVGYTNAADLGLASPYLLPSVAAAVIGGTSILGGSGGYGGTILGALILTELDSLLNLLNASEGVKQMLYGFIVLALAWIYARATRGE